MSAPRRSRTLIEITPPRPISAESTSPASHHRRRSPHRVTRPVEAFQRPGGRAGAVHRGQAVHQPVRAHRDLAGQGASFLSETGGKIAKPPKLVLRRTTLLPVARRARVAHDTTLWTEKEPPLHALIGAKDSSGQPPEREVLGLDRQRAQGVLDDARALEKLLPQLTDRGRRLLLGLASQRLLGTAQRVLDQDDGEGDHRERPDR